MPSDRNSEGSRVRRLLGRALVVTGTVAAGTTVAWMAGAGLPANASAQDDSGQEGAEKGAVVPSDHGPEALLRDTQAGVHGLLAPSAASSHRQQSQQSQQAGPEVSPLRDLDPAALLPASGLPSSELHGSERHHVAARAAGHAPDRHAGGSVDSSGHRSAGGFSGRSAEPSAGAASGEHVRSASASTATGPFAAEWTPSEQAHSAHGSDVLAPVQKSVIDPIAPALAPVTAPVAGAVNGVVHEVRPVLKPAAAVVSQLGDHPEQVPHAVDSGLTELGSPLWTDPAGPAVPPVPRTAPGVAQPTQVASVVAPGVVPPAAGHHRLAHSPRVGKVAAHPGKTPVANTGGQHHKAPKAPAHHPIDMAVPGAPAPAVGGHAFGDDTGLGWCPAMPRPHLLAPGVLVKNRDDAVAGTCGSQPGTTPD